MKPILFVLPSVLAVLALPPGDGRLTALDSRGEARLADPAAAPSAALAWGDVDGDGLPDVLAIRPDGQASALRHGAGGRFEPFADAVGLSALPLLRSAAWQDFDGDGAIDLLYVTAADGLGLLRNEGGALLPITTFAGLPSEGVLDARWADVDADERVDLIVFGLDGPAVYRNAGQARFELGQRLVASLGPVLAVPSPSAPTATPTAEGPATGAPVRLEPGDRGPSPERPPAAPRSPRPGPGIDRQEVVSNETDPGTPSSLGPFQELTFCAPAIADTANGGCLTAASVPALGKLYPLSTNLFVEADGDVGIGTTTPTTKLQVLGLGKTAVSAISDVVGATVVTTSASPSVAALRVGSGTGDLAAFLDGALRVGQTDFVAPFGFLDRTRFLARTDASKNGILEMFDLNGNETVEIDTAFGSGGRLSLRRAAGSLGVQLGGGQSTTGGSIGVHQENGIETVQILGSEVAGNGAQLTMRTFAGQRTFEIDAEGGSLGPVMDFYGVNGNETIELRAEEASGQGSKLTMRRGNGTATVELVAEEFAGQGGQLVLRRADGTATITLDADTAGEGYITADVLQITGGADLVESFDTHEEEVAPGSVLVIDPSAPGALRLSRAAYDERVAGVVSGAGGVKPGLRLGQAALDGPTPVALTGRVWVLCTSENGAVEPGDLLTTSDTPGHAMRASDRERAFGSVLGKALSGLDQERGLVLVLVGLQ